MQGERGPARTGSDKRQNGPRKPLQRQTATLIEKQGRING